MSPTSDETTSDRIQGLPRTYESLLDQSPQTSIFVNRWWLEAMAPGSYEILELSNNEGLLAAWPIVNKFDDSNRHVIMPGLTQKLGILFSRGEGKAVEVQSRNQRRCADLIDKLGTIASFHQNFHESFTDWLPLYWAGFKQTTRYTYKLDDLSDLDSIWDGMRPHHRKAIRKAEKCSFDVRDDWDLQKFLDLNRTNFLRQGRTPLAPDDVVHRLDSAITANAGRRIFTCTDAEGRVHGAAYIAFSRRTAYYLMGAGDPDLRDSGGQLLALWEALRWSRTVADCFDFEGSMLPSVESVFRGFGAKQYSYFSISKGTEGPPDLRAAIKYAITFRLKRLKKRLRLNS